MEYTLAPNGVDIENGGGWKIGWRSSWRLLKEGRERLRKRVKSDRYRSPGEIETYSSTPKKELLSPVFILAPPPPKYEDTLSDSPPDYTTTDQLARCAVSDSPPPYTHTIGSERLASCFETSKSPAKIDFQNDSGYRMHAKKKAKQAAKKAQVAKWSADSDGEKDGNAEEDGGDQKDRGGDAGGSGGGDDDKGSDDKGKEKDKKGKKKQNDEDEDEDEEKDKDKDDTNQDLTDVWNSAGIGNDDDEWGTSSKTKGKKKKKKETDEGFHEISLDDVAEAPKIDISFDSKDKKSDSFGFLGGGGWGNSSWSFSGVEKEKAETKEKKKNNEFSDFDFELDNKLSFDIGESKPDSIWDPVGSKTTKKKGITEIDNPPAAAKDKTGSKWDDYNGWGTTAKKDEKKPETSTWGSWGQTSLSSKEKDQKSKFDWAETMQEESEEEQKKSKDIWGWASNSKSKETDKSKSKAEEDPWSLLTNKESKSESKNDVTETKIEDDDVELDDNQIWEKYGSGMRLKKNEKAARKKYEEDRENKQAEKEAAKDIVAEPAAAADDASFQELDSDEIWDKYGLGKRTTRRENDAKKLYEADKAEHEDKVAAKKKSEANKHEEGPAETSVGAEEDETFKELDETEIWEKYGTGKRNTRRENEARKLYEADKSEHEEKLAAKKSESAAKKETSSTDEKPEAPSGDAEETWQDLDDTEIWAKYGSGKQSPKKMKEAKRQYQTEKLEFEDRQAEKASTAKDVVEEAAVDVIEPTPESTFKELADDDKIWEAYGDTTKKRTTKREIVANEAYQAAKATFEAEQATKKDAPKDTGSKDAKKTDPTSFEELDDDSIWLKYGETAGKKRTERRFAIARDAYITDKLAHEEKEKSNESSGAAVPDGDEKAKETTAVEWTELDSDQIWEQYGETEKKRTERREAKAQDAYEVAKKAFESEASTKAIKTDVAETKKSEDPKGNLKDTEEASSSADWIELDDDAVWEKYGAVGKIRSPRRMNEAKDKYAEAKASFEESKKDAEQPSSSTDWVELDDDAIWGKYGAVEKIRSPRRMNEAKDKYTEAKAAFEQSKKDSDKKDSESVDWVDLDDDAIWEKYGAVEKIRSPRRMNEAKDKYTEAKAAFEQSKKGSDKKESDKKDPESADWVDLDDDTIWEKYGDISKIRSPRRMNEAKEKYTEAKSSFEQSKKSSEKSDPVKDTKESSQSTPAAAAGWTDLDDDEIWQKYGVIGKARSPRRFKEANQLYEDAKAAFEAEQPKAEEAPTKDVPKWKDLVTDDEIFEQYGTGGFRSTLKMKAAREKYLAAKSEFESQNSVSNTKDDSKDKTTKDDTSKADNGKPDVDKTAQSAWKDLDTDEIWEKYGSGGFRSSRKEKEAKEKYEEEKSKWLADNPPKKETRESELEPAKWKDLDDDEIWEKHGSGGFRSSRKEKEAKERYEEEKAKWLTDNPPKKEKTKEAEAEAESAKWKDLDDDEIWTKYGSGGFRSSRKEKEAKEKYEEEKTKWHSDNPSKPEKPDKKAESKKDSDAETWVELDDEAIWLKYGSGGFKSTRKAKEAKEAYEEAKAKWETDHPSKAKEPEKKSETKKDLEPEGWAELDEDAIWLQYGSGGFKSTRKAKEAKEAYLEAKTKWESEHSVKAATKSIVEAEVVVEEAWEELDADQIWDRYGAGGLRTTRKKDEAKKKYEDAKAEWEASKSKKKGKEPAEKPVKEPVWDELDDDQIWDKYGGIGLRSLRKEKEARKKYDDAKAKWEEEYPKKEADKEVSKSKAPAEAEEPPLDDDEIWKQFGESGRIRTPLRLEKARKKYEESKAEKTKPKEEEKPKAIEKPEEPEELTDELIWEKYGETGRIRTPTRMEKARKKYLEEKEKSKDGDDSNKKTEDDFWSSLEKSTTKDKAKDKKKDDTDDIWAAFSSDKKDKDKGPEKGSLKKKNTLDPVEDPDTAWGDPYASKSKDDKKSSKRNSLVSTASKDDKKGDDWALTKTTSRDSSKKKKDSPPEVPDPGKEEDEWDTFMDWGSSKDKKKTGKSVDDKVMKPEDTDDPKEEEFGLKNKKSSKKKKDKSPIEVKSDEEDAPVQKANSVAEQKSEDDDAELYGSIRAKNRKNKDKVGSSKVSKQAALPAPEKDEDESEDDGEWVELEMDAIWTQYGEEGKKRSTRRETAAREAYDAAKEAFEQEAEAKAKKAKKLKKAAEKEKEKEKESKPDKAKTKRAIVEESASEAESDEDEKVKAKTKEKDKQKEKEKAKKVTSSTAKPTSTWGTFGGAGGKSSTSESRIRKEKLEKEKERERKEQEEKEELERAERERIEAEKEKATQEEEEEREKALKAAAASKKQKEKDKDKDKKKAASKKGAGGKSGGGSSNWWDAYDTTEDKNSNSDQDGSGSGSSDSEGEAASDDGAAAARTKGAASKSKAAKDGKAASSSNKTKAGKKVGKVPEDDSRDESKAAATSTSATLKAKIADKGGAPVSKGLVSDRIKALQANALNNDTSTSKKDKKKDLLASDVEEDNNTKSKKRATPVSATKTLPLRSKKPSAKELDAPAPKVKASNSKLPGRFPASDDEEEDEELLINFDEDDEDKKSKKKKKKPTEEDDDEEDMKTVSKSKKASAKTTVIKKSKAEPVKVKSSKIKADSDSDAEDTEKTKAVNSGTQGSGSTTAVDDSQNPKGVPPPPPILDVKPRDKTASKKDRPKVVRQPGAAGWGLFTTPAKSSAKSKIKDREATPKSSKKISAVTDTERSEPERKSSKISPTAKRAAANNLPLFYSTPLPVRTKASSSKRKDSSAKTSVPSKAAKTLGISGKSSSKSRAPGDPSAPYHDDLTDPEEESSDDDDDNTETNTDPKNKDTSSKRKPTSRGKPAPSSTAADSTNQADTATESKANTATPTDEFPRKLKRSNTVSAAPAAKPGGIMNIFGLNRSKSTREPPRRSDPLLESPRRSKRDGLDMDDDVRRDRRSRRSRPIVPEDDGPMTDGPPAAQTDYEDAGRRRRRRGDDRDRRSPDDDRARRPEEDERTPRRSGKDDRRRKEEEDRRKEDEAIAERERAREERRRVRRERHERDREPKESSRPKDDRRRSTYMPDTDQDGPSRPKDEPRRSSYFPDSTDREDRPRRKYRDDTDPERPRDSRRRSYMDSDRDKDRPKRMSTSSSKRQSTTIPLRPRDEPMPSSRSRRLPTNMEDERIPRKAYPYSPDSKDSKDKADSWVKSLASEPPLPVPPEDTATVVEPPPETPDAPPPPPANGVLSGDEDRGGERRRRRRRNRDYEYDDYDDDRRKSNRRSPDEYAYGSGSPTKDNGNGKRSSWFKKITGRG